LQDNQHLIADLKSKLSNYKNENHQLQADVKTLLDFKNELESLAEDQGQKIENQNNVTSSYFHKSRHLGNTQIS
jgi:hypothetical protein